MVTRAVFLDRDGVINANCMRDGRPVAPTTLVDFRLLDGVEAAIRRLKEVGFLVIVVTNQPDVASGRTTRQTVEAMHAVLRRYLLVDDVKACFHTDADNCPCRKPKPGMILEAAAEHNIDLPSSFLVGDRWRDIEAGQKAGCMTILVDSKRNLNVWPRAVVRSLPEAVSHILRRSKMAEAKK